jgi:hypothetical protein
VERERELISIVKKRLFSETLLRLALAAAAPAFAFAFAAAASAAALAAAALAAAAFAAFAAAAAAATRHIEGELSLGGASRSSFLLIKTTNCKRAVLGRQRAAGNVKC